MDRAFQVAVPLAESEKHSFDRSRQTIIDLRESQVEIQDLKRGKPGEICFSLHYSDTPVWHSRRAHPIRIYRMSRITNGVPKMNTWNTGE